MEKLAYILWKPAATTDADFGRTLREEVARSLVDSGAARLSINVADEHAHEVQAARITRFDPPIAGLVTFWLQVSDDRGPQEKILSEATERLAGYLVLESVPIVNTTHTAALGERTPGTNVVACIERPERMTQDAWIAHWFGHHRQVACETQCSYAYVRNEVVRPVTADAPPWAGIVEEGFPTEAVTDPMLWYKSGGDRAVMERNLGRMLESVNAFLDIARVESNPMSEYHISR